MTRKKYSINWEGDKVVSYEVNDVTYATLEDVPSEKDRRKLEAMEEASFDDLDREFEELFKSEVKDARGDSKSPERVILWVFSAVAAITLSIALIATYFNLRQISREKEADGLVVDVIERREYVNEQDRVYEDFYYPVVRFTAADGKTREARLSEGSSPASYEKGERVKVLYDPDHPLDARIKSLDSSLLMWILPGITGILGVAFGGAVYAVQRFLFTEQTAEV